MKELELGSELLSSVVNSVVRTICSKVGGHGPFVREAFTSYPRNMYFHRKLNYSHWNIFIQLFNKYIFCFPLWTYPLFKLNAFRTTGPLIVLQWFLFYQCDKHHNYNMCTVSWLWTCDFYHLIRVLCMVLMS